MLSGRPLLDNQVDAGFFVDREEPLARIERAVERGLNTLVCGDPGIGKTTLLRHLAYRTRTPGLSPIVDFPVRFVRAEGINEGPLLLDRIIDRQPGLSDLEMLAKLGEQRAELVDETRSRTQTGGNDAAGSILQPVIVVDDVTATAGHTLFGLLRDEVWATNFLWIVSTRTNDRGGLLTPPADAFFDSVINLGPLTSSAATALINTRAGVDLGSLPDEVFQMVGGNPRLLLATVRDLLDRPPSQHRARLDVLRWRDQRIQSMGRSEAMFAAELVAMGGASTSDRALLNRLCWTRARAVQIATKLENEGLIVGEHAVANGQGRPRKLYRLATADELTGIFIPAESGQQ